MVAHTWHGACIKFESTKHTSAYFHHEHHLSTPTPKKNWFKSHTWCMWYTIFHTHIQSRAQMVQFLSHCTYRSLYARTYSVSGFPLIKHMRVRTYAWKEAVFIQRCGMAHRFCVVSMSYWKAAAKTSLTVVVPKYMSGQGGILKAKGLDIEQSCLCCWDVVWKTSNHVQHVRQICSNKL